MYNVPALDEAVAEWSDPVKLSDALGDSHYRCGSRESESFFGQLLVSVGVVWLKFKQLPPSSVSPFKVLLSEHPLRIQFSGFGSPTTSVGSVYIYRCYIDDALVFEAGLSRRRCKIWNNCSDPVFPI